MDRKCFEWNAFFKNGRTTLKDDERLGSTPENVQADRFRTVHNIAAIVGVWSGTVQLIFTRDLNMGHIAAKFVPSLLTQEQKKHCRSLPRIPTHSSCRGSLPGTQFR
ncbi:protein GVQW3-like [Silurus meridionalis]|uniref:protein GVQW3-like n=1 Tax=Silurus meridionalis TaxID=175797 RepID=UPI001EEC3E2F|nr:protein GVQW3-like [Silurus meridionalis]